MAAAYFDASALIKLAVQERESEALVEYLQQPIECSTSALSAVEAIRGLRRLTIPEDDIATVLAGFFLIELSTTVLERSALLDPPALRALDAIHLGTALSIDDPALAFVTYDDRLARAARQHGLRVVQPGRKNVE